MASPPLHAIHAATLAVAGVQEQCQGKHTPDVDPGWKPVFRPTLRESKKLGQSVSVWMALWKNGNFVEDSWLVVEDEEPLPEADKAIVSLARWRTERETLAERNAPLGLLIPPGSDWSDIAADLPRFPVIAVTIPKFADGRASSIARLLRDRDGYQGEIRVIGDYILDQMPYMRRVGIDAFQVDDPVLLQALERGEWPEVTDYLQPAGEGEVPAGTRPWTRRKAD